TLRSSDLTESPVDPFLFGFSMGKKGFLKKRWFKIRLLIFAQPFLIWPRSTMDSIRVSEAPDPGSIPGEATLHNQIFKKKLVGIFTHELDAHELQLFDGHIAVFKFFIRR